MDHPREAVFNCLTSGTQDVEAVRKCAWKYWSKRAAALESEERALHSEAPKDVRPCLAGEKTLFLEELAMEAGCATPTLLGRKQNVEAGTG